MCLKPAWIILLVMDFSQATLNTSKKCSFAKAFAPCFLLYLHISELKESFKETDGFLSKGWLSMGFDANDFDVACVHHIHVALIKCV